MKNFIALLLFITSFTVMAQDRVTFYTATGWFGPWPLDQVTFDGTAYGATPNGTPLAEVLMNGDKPYNVACVDFVPKMDGENQVGIISVLNQTNCDAYNAQKATDDALALELSNQLKLIKYGNDIVALIGIRNKSKSLTVEQVATLVSTYAPIQGLLQSGSLETAKVQVNAITPDGVIITASDITYVSGLIDTYLAK